VVLTAYFQQTSSKAAFEVLRNDGLPELIRIFREGMAEPEYQNDLLFVLKVLAMYEDENGTSTVLRAAKDSFGVDSYMWSVIFSQFGERHSNKDRIIHEFSESLPNGFIAISLLDFANGVAIHQDLKKHPFDTPQGIKKIASWLKDTNPEYFSYARSATSALAISKRTKQKSVASNRG